MAAHHRAAPGLLHQPETWPVPVLSDCGKQRRCLEHPWRYARVQDRARVLPDLVVLVALRCRRIDAHAGSLLVATAPRRSKAFSNVSRHAWVKRERIARDLHDTFLQSVQGLVFKFHALASVIPSETSARSRFTTVLAQVDDVISEGRARVLGFARRRSAVDRIGRPTECIRQQLFEILIGGIQNQRCRAAACAQPCCRRRAAECRPRGYSKQFHARTGTTHRGRNHL